MSDRIITYAAEDGPITALFAMAAEPEYGAELQSRIQPLITGVGPVEAAAAVAHCIADLALTDQRPDVIISLGSCGSQAFAQGDILQVASVSYRDMDASPLGFEPGRTPFLDHPAIIPIPQRLPELPAANLSTGADIISGAAYDRIEAEIVDMESFAVLRAAARFETAMIGLRGVSDGAEDLAHYNDWADYLEAVDANLAKVIDRLPEAIRQQPAAYWKALGWAG